MSLHNLFKEVLELQDHWSSRNTDEMRRRGELIRNTGPDLLRSLMPHLTEALGPAGTDLIMEGRDGTGRKTEIPWIRFSSKSRSPRAQDGWYCVLLFHAKGEGVYLSLMHGSTQFINGEYVPHSDEVLYNYVNWARDVLSNVPRIDAATTADMDLGTSRPLGQAYQKSSAVALWHARNQIPDDQKIEAELVAFAGLLRNIYNAADLGRAPGSAPPDIAASRAAIESIARPRSDPRRNKGQGFGLSAEERRTVEIHAMKLAEEQLVREGFELRDVSRTHSYDFIGEKDGMAFIVEVKGTTSQMGSIVLTANEVDAHRERYPNNMLIIVHSIDLERSRRKATASGGIVTIIRPWLPREEHLRPLSYQYTVDEIL